VSLRPGIGATYRLQLRPDFGFADAAETVPYLARLGIDTLYLSPIAEAVPGSLHGYDGTDPTRLRAELGGERSYDELVGACEERGLGICVDHVPNHLATWAGGGWWRELLVGGRTSPVADVFDIDWDAGGGKVVLPLLDVPLASALANGTVELAARDGETVVRVGSLELPLAPGTEGHDVAETLDAQHYRLADWHDPAGRNYRRFSDIDALVGVRLEDPEVLARTHALVIELARARRLSSLRVDHVDGLRRPTSYLRWLARETGVPIVVEKILSRDERLRADWPVIGTTGYETIDDVGGVLVDPHGLDRLVDAGRAEGDGPVDPLTVDTRRLVADLSFSVEIARDASRLGVDPTGFRDVITRLGRYRTYLDTVKGSVDPEEGTRRALWHELDESAVWRSLRVERADGAREGQIGAADRVVDGAADAVVDGAADEVVDALLEPDHRETALGIQQLTVALMAKGVEDTAWYRLAGPLAFCEVGGDPARRRHDALERWHERASARVARRVHGLVPGTTHDTKRAQDVRCRLYALSEMATPFEEGLRALRRAIGLDEDGADLAFETRVAVQLALGVLPPAEDESFPASCGDAKWAGRDVASRLADALVKGAREAKKRSSWASPDESYEARVRELAMALLADRGTLLRRSFGTVLDEAVRLGAINSLSAVVLRHTFPGIPDCYQGDEAWNLSLVDPDNRRPVDFARLEDCLERLGTPDLVDVGELRRSWRDGRVKLHVTASCLRARHGVGADALAPEAAYVRLAASGPASGSVLAFARRAGSQSGQESWAVAVVTRLGGRLEAVGDDLPVGPSYEGSELMLPEDAPLRFIDAISGRRVAVHDGGIDLAQALASLPVALLVAGPAS
jgi:malto-oligosyltrehalose synthase